MKPFKKPAYMLKNTGREHPLWAQLLLFAGLFFLMAFGEAIVLLILYTLFPASEGTFGPADLYSTFGSAATVFLFARLLEKRNCASLSLRLSKNTFFCVEYLTGLLCGAILFSLSILFCVLTDAVQITLSAKKVPFDTLAIFFFGFAIQSFSEELLCRGYILGTLMNSLSLFPAVLLSALLFSALHLANEGIGFLSFINLMLFGILTALVTLRRGSLWAAAGLHAAWNFMQGNIFGSAVSGLNLDAALFSSAFSQQKALINGWVFGAEGGLAVTAVLCLGILFTLFAMEQRDK